MFSELVAADLGAFCWRTSCRGDYCDGEHERSRSLCPLRLMSYVGGGPRANILNFPSLPRRTR